MRAAVVILALAAAAAADDKLAVEPLAPDPARDARIAELIDQLREIEKPYDGITCTSGGGVGFDALRADEDTPPAFRELVRLGPAAMPALLKHLDDKRETKLSLCFVDEILGNRMFARPEIPAMSPEERVRIRRVLGPAAEKEGPVDAGLGEPIKSHTVTVGDCCFAILGQIVNRSYEAARYQPSLLAIVSSPTREPRIAKVLRGRWGRGDPRQILAESLLDDFRQRKWPGIWAGATERLLVYFPEIGDELVAKRIRAIHWDDDFEGFCGQELLRHVLPTGCPRVHAEWLRLLRPDLPKAAQIAVLEATPSDAGDAAHERIRAMLGHTMDAEILLAGIRVLPREKAADIVPRLEANLRAAVDREESRRSLAALVLLDDGGSLQLVRAHMERFGVEGCETVLSALDEDPTSGLARSLLPSLLDVTAPVQGLPGLPEPMWRARGETRLCDWAAHLIVETRKDLAFDRHAPVEERDRQIAAIRAALDK